MPIYVASALNKGQSVDPVFLDRGLEYVRTTCTGSGIYARPTHRQIAYSGYMANLFVFIYATITQVVTMCNLPGYAYTIPAASVIPIALPTVIIAYAKGRIQKEVKDLWNSKGWAYSGTDKTGEKWTVFKPTREDIRDVLKTGPDEEARSPVGTSNLAGIKAFTLSLKFLTGFLMSKCVGLMLVRLHL